MRSKYQNLNRTLLGYPCLSIKDKNEYDDSIIGEKGELWAVNDKICRIVLFRPKVDKIIIYDIKDLRKAIRRINVIVDMDRAVALGNTNR